MSCDAGQYSRASSMLGAVGAHRAPLTSKMGQIGRAYAPMRAHARSQWPSLLCALRALRAVLFALNEARCARIALGRVCLERSANALGSRQIRPSAMSAHLVLLALNHARAHITNDERRTKSRFLQTAGSSDQMFKSFHSSNA